MGTATPTSEPAPNESNEDVILEIENANVTFDMDRGTSRVLEDATLEVHREEILGIVGESGSGKSMFASALLDAVVKPGVLTGDITYYRESGEAVDVLAQDEPGLMQLRWEEIAMVFQGAMSAFNPTMNMQDHFLETLEAHGYPVDDGMERARDILSDLYLDPERVFKAYPHELSGGMQQRALIALSLVLEPEVVVMDEPTAALDLLMQRSIMSLLENLQEKYDLTVIFITHDLPLVAGLADRLAVMYAFQFVEKGPSNEVLDHAAHPYTRALLKSVPNIDSPVDQMSAIEGSAPDPVDPPQGCSYHTRCPLATEQCQTSDPQMRSTTEASHTVSCYHWEDSADAIQYTTAATDNTSASHDIDIAARNPTADPVISLNDVEVHFDTTGFWSRVLPSGDEDVVRAVDGVSLDVYEEEVVALVGESGCGKTTLGKTVIGAQRPTGGSVEYRGQDIWEAKSERDPEISFNKIRRALQIIHQDPGSSLNPNKTVQAALASPLKKWHADLSTDDRRARIYKMLETVGMKPAEDYAHRYPHQLSGGEKQRVALIRATLVNPEVILADEAVSALDVSLRVEMMDLMLELQDMFGTSFVFVSHDLSNARYFAKKAGGRIGVMYLGELVEIGTVDEIVNDPQHPYTQILRWATPNLDMEETEEHSPIRDIDIPDPEDPPSGCRFHTRCPKAREVCTRESPELSTDAGDTGTGEGHRTACFRQDDNHEYWRSESITEESADPEEVVE